MMDMGTKYLITTEFPTPEEIASFHKIPPERVAELRRRIDAVREAESRQRIAAPRRKPSSKKK